MELKENNTDRTSQLFQSVLKKPKNKQKNPQKHTGFTPLTAL